ncbi:mitochondrial processing peptidase alpha subunit [Novymonas esmeraldas]|uniref:Mitochondrial processing peptidase alpha subunit n=1 Tax=Novymonas esmeraldas TaxID=1808958 RepID=A0AAW0EP69_9TRYP
MLRRAAAPVSVTATAAQVRSIYEYKFGHTPLSKPFGGASRLPPAAPSAPAPVKAGAVEVSKLHNGARVISQNLGGPSVSIGAYILAGPAYDPPSAPGAGAMMHLALTTSNYNNALFQLDRNIRSVGAAQTHFERNKHYIGIRIDARADKWKSAAATASRAQRRLIQHNQKQAESQFSLNLVQDNIFTCIAAPRFHEPDVERFRDTIDNQVEELRWRYPAEYARQMIETVAFYREPLGNPRFVPAISNAAISSNVLLDQYSRYVVPSRVVIAGVNVEHAALIAEYENSPFAHSASAPHHARAQPSAVNTQNESAQYTGGERHDHEDRPKAMGTKPDMTTESIVAVGWLTYGKDRKMLKDHAATLVVKALLDIQFQDSMRYARDETHEHTGLRAYYSPYNTAGLIGFVATAEPQAAVRIVTDAVKAVQAGRSSIADSTLAVAKSMAATQFLVQNSDTIRDYCDYLGTSLDMANDSTVATSLEEVTDAIRAVGAADVKRVYEKMLASQASLYAHGEVLGFPSLRQMGL